MRRSSPSLAASGKLELPAYRCASHVQIRLPASGLAWLNAPQRVWRYQTPHSFGGRTLAWPTSSAARRTRTCRCCGAARLLWRRLTERRHSSAASIQADGRARPSRGGRQQVGRSRWGCRHGRRRRWEYSHARPSCRRSRREQSRAHPWPGTLSTARTWLHAPPRARASLRCREWVSIGVHCPCYNGLQRASLARRPKPGVALISVRRSAGHSPRYRAGMPRQHTRAPLSCRRFCPA